MQLTEAEEREFKALGDENYLTAFERYLRLRSAWRKAFAFTLEESPYLAKRISNLIFLNERNERLAVDPENRLPTNGFARVIVQVDHIEIEYTNNDKQPNSLRASNFQFDYDNAQDIDQAKNAIEEKVIAAYALANLAYESGITHVTLKDSDDPLDKFILTFVAQKCRLQVSNPFVNVAQLPMNEALRGGNEPDLDIRDLLSKNVEAALNVIQKRPDKGFGIEPPTYPYADNDNELSELDQMNEMDSKDRPPETKKPEKTKGNLRTAKVVIIPGAAPQNVAA